VGDARGDVAQGVIGVIVVVIAGLVVPFILRNGPSLGLWDESFSGEFCRRVVDGRCG
jgi:hypothetical protein